MNNMIQPKRGKVYNPQWADILEEAIPLLWDGEGPVSGDTNRTICATLDGLEGEVHALQSEITQRLRNEASCFYFSTFYRNRAQAGSKSFISPQEIQAARKAWMLDMVEEFRDEQNSVEAFNAVEAADEQNKA